MEVGKAGDSDDTLDLLERTRKGDRQALDELFSRHRDRLSRMVRLRLDSRLKGRIDASDVIQEAYLEASQRLAEYHRNPSMPFFIWLRFITAQKVLTLHRHHLGTQARDPRREVSLHHGAWPEATSASLAAQLVGTITSPTQAAARAEMKIRFEEALNSMDPMEREVVALRHFEQLTNAETAQVLSIETSTASKRYIRSLRKLKDILRAMPGGTSSFR